MNEEAIAATPLSVSVSIPPNPIPPISQQRSIVTEMAHRFGMERAAFEATLKKTIMPAGAEASNEQVAAFLVVASKHNLDPFTKEIFAFPTRIGGIQPVVSIDGWLKIINEHPQFDGMELEEKFDGGQIVATTCKMYRKDRKYPVIVTEYLSECTRNTDQWKQKPVRMLRHKATIQAARYAFGFSGIVDPDEAERMAEYGVVDMGSDTAKRATLGTLADLRSKLTAANDPVILTVAPNTPND